MQPENGLFACLLLQHAIQNFGACPIFGCVHVLHAVAGDFDADAAAVENGLVLCGKHPISLTMRFMPAGHLLFFASPKKSKQKKGDPDVQVWLRQTSLTAHPFSARAN